MKHLFFQSDGKFYNISEISFIEFDQNTCRLTFTDGEEVLVDSPERVEKIKSIMKVI